MTQTTEKRPVLYESLMESIYEFNRRYNRDPVAIEMSRSFNRDLIMEAFDTMNYALHQMQGEMMFLGIPMKVNENMREWYKLVVREAEYFG